METRRELVRKYQMPGARPGTQVPGKLIQDDYTYTHPLVVISTAAPTASAYITIEPDSDFDILSRSTCFIGSNLDADSASFDLNYGVGISIVLTDVASGQTLCRATQMDLYGGNGQTPFTLGQIKRFAARQMIKIDYAVINTAYFSADVAYLQTSFTGRKRFHKG